MGLQFHPKPGTIVICDFGQGFRVPEMVKRRPAIVVSPQIQGRPNLCTIVPMSTGIPKIKQSYHVELPNLVLPAPYDQGPNWVKADMIFASAYSRLDLIRSGNSPAGQTVYATLCLSDTDLRLVRAAMRYSLGLSKLTKHL